MRKDNIKNVQELKQELLRISETDEQRNTRLFALALTYLLSELCPPDRSTKHVIQHAWRN